MIARLVAWTRRAPGTALLLLACACAVALYAPSLGRGLVHYDDTWLVRDNYLLHDPSSIGTVVFDLSPATRFQLGSEYLPVRDLSVLADLAVWGDWYAGHHLTNIVVYLAAIALWFAALVELGVDPKLAGLAMLLWAVHPAHAESVAWLSERKGLLGVAWSGAAALGYAKFRGGRSARWVAFAAVAAAFAVWSKAPSVTTIAAFAGLELALPDRRASARRALAGLGLLAVVVAGAFVPVLITALRTSVVGGEDVAPAGWLAMAVGGHGFYLELAALAVRDAISYPIATAGPSAAQLALGALGLAAVVAAAVVPARGRWRPPGVVRAAAWLWLFGWLPASRLVLPLRAVLVADRYLLVPTLGVALAAAWGLGKLAHRRLGIALTAVVVIASGARAFDAQASWRDSLTLYARAVASNPGDGAAWAGYAEALEDGGDHDAALAATAQGLAEARAPRLLLERGLLLAAHGSRAEALAVLAEAAEAGEPRAMANLALLLLEDRRTDDARVWAERAVAAAPRYAPAYRNLGAAYAALHRPEDAYRAFLRAYELYPAQIASRFNLGLALVELHRYAEARVHLEACLADPQYAAPARAALARLPR